MPPPHCHHHPQVFSRPSLLNPQAKFIGRTLCRGTPNIPKRLQLLWDALFKVFQGYGHTSPERRNDITEKKWYPPFRISLETPKPRKDFCHLLMNLYCKLLEPGNRSRFLLLKLSPQALPSLPSPCIVASWGAESGSSWAVVALAPACHLKGTTHNRHLAQYCSVTGMPTFFSLKFPIMLICKMSGFNEMISETLPISNRYF